MKDENIGGAKGNGLGRRDLLGRGAVMMGGLVAAQALMPAAAKAQQGRKVKKASTSNDDSFTVCIAGETMCTRAFSMQTDPGFIGIVKLMREADLAYCHLEVNIASDDEITWTPRGSSGGAGYLITDPQVAKDLAWMGIDATSTAMNHSYDWGPGVMLATSKHCNEAGIATAGTGINLEVARSATFFELDKGRMAMVSIASGNSSFEWAGLPKGKSPGRPGVNQMRVKQIYEVPHEVATQLKAAGRGMGTLSAAGAEKPEFTITPQAIAGSNGFSGAVIKDGTKYDVYSEANPADVRGNLRSIDQAMKMADYTLVAHHSSTSDKGRGEQPNSFMVDFARKAIDAGADVYLGHGWHTFVGIEIYKGKPIFYGLGSFFWQSQFITRVPADSYESYDVDMDTLGAVNSASGNLHPEGNPDWGWSAVYRLTYSNKKLAKIELFPIEMGYDYTGDKPVRTREIGHGEEKYLDGSPRLSYGANGQAILKKLQHMCELRGTAMKIEGNIGVIAVA